MEKKLITLISSPFLSKKWKVEDSHSQHVIRIFEKNKKNKGGGKKTKILILTSQIIQIQFTNF